jgi:pimeloyl-ACP methyl ester carboxylesterase
MALWLASAYAVAALLTRRHAPVFSESVPAAAWGRFVPYRLRTREGHALGAWLVRGTAGAPAVVLLHGNGGCRTTMVGRARILAEAGCTVLAVTLRAHGDSTGTRNDIGYSARHDVVAAVELLERECPGAAIVLHGTSLGAAAAVFAARELDSRVSGYILESPYQDLKIAVRNRTENALPPVLDAIAYYGLLLISRVVLPELEAIAPVSAIGAIPGRVPVLILAGALDRNARPGEAQALFDRVRSHARLVVFEGAGHMTFPDTNPADYRRWIHDFVAAPRLRSGHPSHGGEG